MDEIDIWRMALFDCVARGKRKGSRAYISRSTFLSHFAIAWRAVALRS